jgi:subtilase family serine protease
MMSLFRFFRAIGAGLCAGACHIALAATPAGDSKLHNTPQFIAIATPKGSTDAAKTIEVMIWLKLRNKAALDQLSSALYDPTSPSYRRWITPAEFETRFAPTAADAATVARFFKAHDLSVVEVGPKNMWVKARGPVATVNRAFHVELRDFEFQGRTVYANTVDPVVEGAAGALTAAVYGLHDLQYSHPLATPSVPEKFAGDPFGPAVNSNSAAHAAIAASAPPVDAVCLGGATTEFFKSGGNSYPYVTLKGNVYAPGAGALGYCGYTPPEIHTAFGLSKLYSEGYDGSGQTIVIIDWCGSPTIRSDANRFAAVYGLPPLTEANFHIINSSTPPVCSAPDVEINIDVEWAHAIAPGATIDLVVPPTPDFTDVDTGVFFAVINALGNVISGSYQSPEYYHAPAELEAENLINEIAAVQGISANFASGDYGDGFGGSPLYPPFVSVPADTPFATAVGGTSLVLKSDKSIEWQSGWGTDLTPIDVGGFVYDPPTEYGGFQFGSGGGASSVFSKPAFQRSLPGPARLVPDISWLADPFTGAVVVISEPFQVPEQVYAIYGGTSLACPMFSALWAIANQEAGVPLGQAAQYVYSMPSSTITDITPVSSRSNVTAVYRESPTVTDVYPAADFAPLDFSGDNSSSPFVSAIWNYPLYQDTAFVLTFGVDSSLFVSRGWDDVTGVGVPIAKPFADYFKP